MIPRILVCAFFFVPLRQDKSPRQPDQAEEIRSAYLQFVQRVEALATSVTADTWSPDVVARFMPVDPDHLSRAPMAKSTTSKADVIWSTSRFALLVANRDVKFPANAEAPEESVHDSILAVLGRGAEPSWRVASQIWLAHDDKIEPILSPTSDVPTAARETLETILKAITAGNRQAVENCVSRRDGQVLSGEIGSFLHDSKPKKTRLNEIEEAACTGTMCVFSARITSVDTHPDPKDHVAGWRTISRPVLVFRRAPDDSWKLDAELLFRL